MFDYKRNEKDIKEIEKIKEQNEWLLDNDLSELEQEKNKQTKLNVIKRIHERKNLIETLERTIKNMREIAEYKKADGYRRKKNNKENKAIIQLY